MTNLQAAVGLAQVESLERNPNETPDRSPLQRTARRLPSSAAPRPHRLCEISTGYGWFLGDSHPFDATEMMRRLNAGRLAFDRSSGQFTNNRSQKNESFR